ncbi:hypothetical protein AAFF_G00337810 [Aldrovandia affinis]|uniref:Uncharacterized protein n=1 Tax=Aldrovandia affinis TaxID=143900 RepID=A0AAD7SKX7_9TELE|nr:hypothetical protein AAFF_G00337810 [Aldrovandia affinis]
MGTEICPIPCSYCMAPGEGGVRVAGHYLTIAPTFTDKVTWSHDDWIPSDNGMLESLDLIERAVKAKLCMLRLLCTPQVNDLTRPVVMYKIPSMKSCFKFLLAARVGKAIRPTIVAYRQTIGFCISVIALCCV